MRRFALGLVLCSVAVVAWGDDLSRYTGNYRLGERVLAIAEWETDPAAPHVLAFTDLRSGRFGVLTESGANTFALHEGVMAGPVRAHIRFVTQGDRVSGLVFDGRRAKRELAARVRLFASTSRRRSPRGQ
jgi:hypothetical protein